MSPSPAEALAKTYGAIAEWLLYPEEIEDAMADEAAAGEAIAAAGRIDGRIGEHLEAFWRERRSVDPEAYLELLELNPRCPLYLGSYQFPEPTTCSAAGVSDRNQYMLEIGNVYRHFGFEIAGELPDYLPAMTEFLALSSGCSDADAGLRRRFIVKLVLPGARTFAERLEETGAVYRHLADALVGCLEWETPDRDEEPPAEDGQTAEREERPAARPLPRRRAGGRAKVVTID
ncbi:MAG: hypothetical protein U0R52_02845 [Solirubrobacterales bacterium]